jgi:hypothetical protein
MVLLIKRFKTTLKGRKDCPNKNKSRGKRSCFECGKTDHFIAQCTNNENDQVQEKKGKKKKFNRKTKGEAYIGKEWDSDCSSSDDEGLAASAFDKSSLFSNEHHTFLMAKEKKVLTRDTPKYTSSSDEECDNVDYNNLFKGLDRSKVDKINELIDAHNEKDRLLEKQEDLLYEEHDKIVEVEKSLALGIKKNEMLAFELSSCHSSITILKSLNDDLNARIEKVNVTSSSIECVSICAKCKGHDFNVYSNHASTMAKLNDEIANLNAQLKNCKNEVEKVKFARDAFTIGRHPSIKDGLGLQKGTKNTKSQKDLNLTKEKGKAPMASSMHPVHENRNHAHLYSHVNNTSLNAYHVTCNDKFTPHIAIASSSDRSRSRRHAPRNVSYAPKNASHGPSILFRTYDASYVIHCKNDRIVAKMWDQNARKVRLVFRFPKLM